jgi:hypothetical protein
MVEAAEAHVSRYAAEFAALVHATGPVTYDYQFLRRELFDAVVKRSWAMAGSLFAYDETTLALDGDDPLGMVVRFQGPAFI